MATKPTEFGTTSTQVKVQAARPVGPTPTGTAEEEGMPIVNMMVTREGSSPERTAVTAEETASNCSKVLAIP
jgi:hypothetical protein